MVVKEEQERVRGLIADTVTLLCRNGLQYKSKFCINALIGITLDEEDVFLVDIRETIKNVDENSEADSAASEEMPAKSSSRKRKKHRKRSKSNESISKTEGAQHSESASERGSNNTPADLDNPENSSEPPLKRLVKLEDDDEDSGDLVFVKDEPADSDLSSSAFGNVSQLYQHQQSGDSNSLLDSLSQQGQLYGDVQPGSTSWGGDQNLPAAMPPPNMQAPAGATDSQSQGYSEKEGQQCTFCGVVIRCKGTFKKHMDRHFGIYSYICKECGRGFSSTATLKGHLVSAHSDTGHSRVCCLLPACRSTFTRRDKMVRHMRTCHPEAAATLLTSPGSSKKSPEASMHCNASGTWRRGRKKLLEASVEDTEATIIKDQPLDVKDNVKAEAGETQFSQWLSEEHPQTPTSAFPLIKSQPPNMDATG